jgi:23S rRNA (uridine2552-2'-O)-methyltransferase
MARDKGDNPYRKGDAHTRAAKAMGYGARSVFKLKEIDSRLRLLKQNQHVLDLGAAPGSWSTFACERVGKHGRVVAIDLQSIDKALPSQWIGIQGDAFDTKHDTEGPIAEHAPYDVVLSDMAPNTTGDKSTDQYRSFEVFTRAVDMALRMLKPGGHFVGKIFMSGHFPEARESLRGHFDKVRTLRPEAVRSVSYEVFLVGIGRKSEDAEASSEPSH